jgi:hypothetical protein
MNNKILLISLLLSLIVAGCSPKSINIDDPWARPGTTGGNSAVYFIIKNPGVEDTLLNATSNAAINVELHMSKMGSDGTMMMEPQSSVPIPAKGEVEFKPGGLHIMLIGLNNNLNIGDVIQVTLNFQNAGEIQLEVPIKQP